MCSNSPKDYTKAEVKLKMTRDQHNTTKTRPLPGGDGKDEPGHEKTCQGLPTRSEKQSGLYGHKRWLEAWNFLFRKKRDCTIFCSENKGTSQLRSYSAADMHLCFRICKKQVF